MKSKRFDADFIATMLQDSLLQEQANEPGQAFDKLARAIESQLPIGQEQYQSEKASAMFQRAVQSEHVWCQYVECHETLENLSRNMQYYLRLMAAEDADELVRRSRRFGHAVEAGERSNSADSFAKWVMYFRNKRFHGDPGFSGTNIRLLHDISVMLRLLRCHVSWLLETGVDEARL